MNKLIEYIDNIPLGETKIIGLSHYFLVHTSIEFQEAIQYVIDRPWKFHFWEMSYSQGYIVTRKIIFSEIPVE